MNRTMWRGASITLGVGILAAVCGQPGAQAQAPATEISRLLQDSASPSRFQGYTPRFSVQREEFAVGSGMGATRHSLTVLKDGPRYVAICDPLGFTFDLLAFDPTRAPEKLELPPDWTPTTTLGTRFTPYVHFRDGGPSGDQRDFNPLQENGAYSFFLREEWFEDRKGNSTYVIRFRVDPVRGYVVDVITQLDFTRGSRRKAEEILGILNVQPANLANPWPGRARYDRTLYTPKNAADYAGWWNNPAAARRSHAADDYLSVRSGGFTTFVGEKGSWSPVISYPESGGRTVLQRTDHRWLGQRCFITLPAQQPGQPDRPFLSRFELSGLPPEATDRLAEKAVIPSLEGQRAVMVRIGVPEDFEAQPLPLDTRVRGLVGSQFQLSDREAHSGKQAMIVLGKQPKAQPDSRPQVEAPAIPLEADRTYRLQAWIKVGSGQTEGFVSADLVADPANVGAFLKRQRTPSVKPGEGWKQVSLEFSTGRSPCFLDLRFQAVGNGSVYFDDFSLTRVED